jgi:hypothetical protein
MRFATTVPTQALTLLNSAFMKEQSDLFARRLTKEAPGGVDAAVRLALASVTQRPVTDREVERGVALIRRLQEKDGLSPERALADFCLVALNLNEFVYLD